MIIIIDAYNVLRSIMASAEIADTQKNYFLKKLGEYAVKKNHELIIVFDGGNARYPYSEHCGPLHCMYAGELYTADDIILKLINTKKNHEVIVVSRDRMLCAAIQKYDVPTIDPEDFWPLVIQSIPIEKKVPKTGTIKKYKKITEEYDALIEEASYTTIPKESSEEKNDTQKHVSKKEKKLLNIIKKL